MGLYTQLNANNPQWFTSHLSQSVNSPTQNKRQQRRRLVVISHDKTQRDLLRDQAKIWEMEVILASSAMQGLTILKETVQLNYDIQLAFIEHELPNIDAIKLVRTCRQQKDIPFFPVILLTTTLIPLSANEMMQLGIVEQLLIPFSINRLYDTVTRVVPANDDKLLYTNTTQLAAFTMGDKTSATHKILVVEDSLLNRNLIISMLKRLGQTQVDVAENGQEALEKVATQVYDLILMDCQMPILDGYVTAREIRRREIATGQLRTPIIALTAYALPEHRLAAQAADMDEHVTKPIRLDTLSTILKHWLNAKHSIQPTENIKIIDMTSSLDLKIIEDLYAVMGEATHSLLLQFVEYAPVQIASLRALAKKSDFELLQHKAHQFKGESAQLGAVKLSHLCRDLEKLAKEHQFDQVMQCVQKLEEEVEQTNHILKQQIAHILQLEASQ